MPVRCAARTHGASARRTSEGAGLRAVRHNADTRHLQKLLHHVIERLRGAAKRRGSAAEAVNALVLARVVLKYLAEGLAGPQLAAFVDAPVAPAASQPADQGARPAHACRARRLLAGRARPGLDERVAAHTPWLVRLRFRPRPRPVL